MKLEEEIQQQKFRNEYQKGVVNIIYTFGWLRGRLTRAFKKHNISMQQYNVLRILNGQFPKGISTSEIRKRMLDKMSDVSRIVDRMEKLSLVEKSKDKRDRRLIEVKITARGKILLEKMKSIEKETDDLIREKLTKEEAQQLNFLLDKIRCDQK